MKATSHPGAKRGFSHAARHPHAIPTLPAEEFADREALTEIGPDLRDRLVSEAAYRRFVDRGCLDGYDIDDRLAAAADVEREFQVVQPLVEP